MSYTITNNTKILGQTGNPAQIIYDTSVFQTYTQNSTFLFQNVDFIYPTTNGASGQSLTRGSTGSLWADPFPEGATGAIGPSGLPGPIGNTGATASTFVGNTIYVDPVYGSNITGQRQRFDLPFITVSAAIVASNPGDVIIVRPGLIPDPGTLGQDFKSDVNIYLSTSTQYSYAGGLSLCKSPYSITGKGLLQYTGGTITSLATPFGKSDLIDIRDMIFGVITPLCSVSSGATLVFKVSNQLLNTTTNNVIVNSGTAYVDINFLANQLYTGNTGSTGYININTTRITISPVLFRNSGTLYLNTKHYDGKVAPDNDGILYHNIEYNLTPNLAYGGTAYVNIINNEISPPPAITTGSTTKYLDLTLNRSSGTITINSLYNIKILSHILTDNFTIGSSGIGNLYISSLLGDLTGKSITINPLSINNVYIGNIYYPVISGTFGGFLTISGNGNYYINTMISNSGISIGAGTTGQNCVVNGNNFMLSDSARISITGISVGSTIELNINKLRSTFVDDSSPGGFIRIGGTGCNISVNVNDYIGASAAAFGLNTSTTSNTQVRISGRYKSNENTFVVPIATGTPNFGKIILADCSFIQGLNTRLGTGTYQVQYQGTVISTTDFNPPAIVTNIGPKALWHTIDTSFT